MNALADKVSERNVASIFLYTHEAHPGENYPHLTSMAQKVKHAEELRDVLGVTRPILLDSLEGDCHQAYGMMPNMTWIINRAGVPVYRSNWTDCNSVENAIAYYLDVAERRREKERLVPFQVARLDYRTSDRTGFETGLKRNGPKALREYLEFEK